MMPGRRPPGEIYLPLSVGFPSDPKVRALAQFGCPDAGLARDLYVQMAIHCKANLTDGYVAEYELGILVFPLDVEHGKQLAKQLASVGLIKEEAGGWQVAAYVRRNGTREEVEALSKTRAVQGAKGGKVSRKPARQRPSQANSKQVADGLFGNLPPRDRDRDRDIKEQTPTASAATSAAASNPNGLTITQRSKRLVDAYAAAEPMCKWPAVNGVVIHAIKSGKYADDEIRDALLRMAAENRSVTIDSLRTEIGGLPPSQRASSAPKKTNYTDAEYASGF